MVTRSAVHPSPHTPGSLPCGVGWVWGPNSPCGLVVGIEGLGLKGIRFRVEKCLGFAKVDGLCSAFRLEPASSGVYCWVLGLKYRLRLIQRSTRYDRGFMACGLAKALRGPLCDPWPPPSSTGATPPPLPDHTSAGAGEGENARTWMCLGLGILALGSKQI